MKDRAHDDAMAEVFRKDPAYVVELLNSLLEDNDQGELLIALRQMTKALGGVSQVADKAQLNGMHFYPALSAKGNPKIRSLAAVLKPMGVCQEFCVLSHTLPTGRGGFGFSDTGISGFLAGHYHTRRQRDPEKTPT